MRISEPSFTDCGIDAAVEPKERLGRGSMTHCAIDPFLALVAAKEAHQIGARIYSATTTEYIRDV